MTFKVDSSEVRGFAGDRRELYNDGASVREVQVRLGHSSAAETLNTYAHLWPDSDDRTREAVQVVLGDPVYRDVNQSHGPPELYPGCSGR